MIKRTLAGMIFSASLFATLHAQSPDAAAPAAFEIADVHASPHRKFPFSEGGNLHGDRYVIRQSTMVDLIAAAYGVDVSNVQGGPSWLETDRFDIVAKASPATSPAVIKQMLQSLLADRFKLVIHTGSKPMPAYVLSLAASKPKFKSSEDADTNGCNAGPSAPGDPYIQVACRNLSMDEFAANLRMMAGGYLAEPVVNSTGLDGTWDLDIHWTGRGQLDKAGADGISIFDAVTKQLGLKLELKTAPRPVLIVDSVHETPTANPPGIEKVLPTPPPAEFEVATIKPGKPDGHLDGRITGNQINLQGATLKFLMSFAWDLNPSDNEGIVNAPKWFDFATFDILAKAPVETVVGSAKMPTHIDTEDLQSMLRTFLMERFEMKLHTEDRPLNAYTLIALKPRLKPADPASRTRCYEGPGPDGKDPRLTNPNLNRLLTCQNMTMAQIGDELQRVANGYIYTAVVDATGIPGSFDFTLSFSSADKMAPGAAAASGDSGAPDPSGAMSLFDAVTAQLGLKLEKRRRPVSVLVIDHIDEKPTEN